MLSLLLSSFFISNPAFAVPLQMTQQGRILDSNGAAVVGTNTISFRIYDAETNGSIAWSETLAVQFHNGYYAAILGTDEQNNPLDSSVFQQYPLYMEIQLNSNNPMTPRKAINSAPYAQIAGVAESVEGNVDATEIYVNGSMVVDGSGNWVGQSMSVDWNSIDQNTIPGYILDGDDNTQLSETEVETYVTNDAVNLAANSQVNGSNILTESSSLDWSNLSATMPTDIADGDDDTLSGLSCATGEIASWDGNSSWVCTSDATLSLADVQSMLNNNPVDLHASTTIGGMDIITAVDDSDTLADLSCGNGEVAKYDDTLAEWYCDVDIDTVLSGSDVIAHVEGSSVNLATGSQVNSRNIVSQPTACSNGQVLVYNATSSDWECGDDTDTTLTPTEMQAAVEAMTLNLQNIPQVNGVDVLTADSTIATTQVDSSAGTDGQVLTINNGMASWADAGGGNTCEQSIHNHADGSFYTFFECNGFQYVNTASGPTNAFESNDICSTSFIEMQSSGVVSIVDCNGSTIAVRGSEQSTAILQSLSPQQQHTSNEGLCGLGTNDNIYCWGNDSHGIISDIPTGSYIQLAHGQEHKCALSTNGTIDCWGYDNHGQVSNTPNGVYSQVSAGSYHNCAILDSDKTLSCWGYDGNSQISSMPSDAFLTLESYDHYTCGITTSNVLKCWGGGGSYNNALLQTPSNDFSSIDISGSVGCGVTTAGQPKCWGYDYAGVVSDAPQVDIIQVETASSDVCAIKTNGELVCWGYSYQYGGTPPSGTFTKISGQDHRFCALATNGSLECWGPNQTSAIPVSGTFIDVEATNRGNWAVLETGNIIGFGSSTNLP